jgi:hypothetical protein
MSLESRTANSDGDVLFIKLTSAYDNVLSIENFTDDTEGENTSNYWTVYNTSQTVIDATNFSTIDSGANIITLEDSLSDFTGNGYMYLNSDTLSTFSTINYPVRAITSDTYNLWMRVININSENLIYFMLRNLNQIIEIRFS